MDIADKNGAKPLGGILASLINIDARECRAEMFMVDDRGKQLIRVRIRRTSTLTRVVAAGRHVKKMINDARAHEGIAGAVEIKAPRIAGTICKDLELFCAWVIPRDSGIDGDAVVVGVFGISHLWMSENALSHVE